MDTMDTEMATIRSEQVQTAAIKLENSEGFAIQINSDYSCIKGIYGPRFENLGRVTQASLHGQDFLTKEGLIDEIGIMSHLGPLGYAEAALGDSFVKVGVGELQRIEENSYRFHQPYTVLRENKTQIEQNRHSVTFSQEALEHLVWKYIYRKRYSIDPQLPVLTIDYELTNCSERRMHSEQYNHNWFHFDTTESDREYNLHVGFDPLVVTDSLCTEKPFVLELEAKTIKVPTPLNKPSHINFPNIGNPIENRILLSRDRDSRQVEICGDFPVSRFALYGQEEIVCPEVFIDIDLEPQETMQWSRVYTFKI